MGCVQGKQFVSNTKIKGQGPSVLDIAKKLRLNKFQLDGFYNHFCKMDIDGDYKVEIEEFLIVNDIKSMYFGELVFRLFDSDKSGSLDFEEYLVAMWNFCTLDKHALIAFAFNLFDVDSSGSLSRNELTCIIDIIHGYKQTDRLNVALKKLEGRGDVNLKQFIDFARELPVLLFPAFEIQDRLRSSLFGITRWNGITDDRRKAFGQASVFEILERETKYADKAIELLIKRVPDGHIDKVRQVTTVMRRKSLNASRRSSLASSLGSIEERRKSIGGSVHGDEDEDEHDVVDDSHKDIESAVALNTLLNAQLGKVAAAAAASGSNGNRISASRDNSFNQQGGSKRDQQQQQRSVQLQERDTSSKTSNSVSLNHRGGATGAGGGGGGRYQPDASSHMKTAPNSPSKDKINNNNNNDATTTTTASTTTTTTSKSVSISISASLNRDKIMQNTGTSSSALSAKFLDDKQRKRSRHSSTMTTSFAELPSEYNDTSAATYIMNRSNKSATSNNNNNSNSSSRSQGRLLRNDMSISSINTYSSSPIINNNNNNSNNNNKSNKKSEKSMKSTTSNTSTNTTTNNRDTTESRHQYHRRKSRDDSEFLYNYEDVQRFSDSSSNHTTNNSTTSNSNSHYTTIQLTKQYHSDRDMLKIGSNKLVVNNTNKSSSSSSSPLSPYNPDGNALVSSTVINNNITMITTGNNSNNNNTNGTSHSPSSPSSPMLQLSRKITSNRFHERSTERRSINSDNNDHHNLNYATTSSSLPISSARLENVKPFSSNSNSNNTTNNTNTNNTSHMGNKNTNATNSSSGGGNNNNSSHNNSRSTSPDRTTATAEESKIPYTTNTTINNNGWMNDNGNDYNNNDDHNNDSNNNKKQNKRRNQRNNNNNNTTTTNTTTNDNNMTRPAPMKRKKSSVTAPLPPLKIKSALNLNPQNDDDDGDNNHNHHKNKNNIGSNTTNANPVVPSSARAVIESARGLINRFLITTTPATNPNLNTTNGTTMTVPAIYRVKDSQVAPMDV